METFTFLPTKLLIIVYFRLKKTASFLVSNENSFSVGLACRERILKYFSTDLFDWVVS